MYLSSSAGAAHSRAVSLAAMHFAAGAACVSLVSVLLVRVTAVGPAYAGYSLGVFTALSDWYAFMVQIRDILVGGMIFPLLVFHAATLIVHESKVVDLGIYTE